MVKANRHASSRHAETRVGTILALAVYGFRTTLAGRPVALTRFEPQPFKSG
jgi:hypothetical protein